MTWDPGLYGTLADPVHQSDIGQLLGSWGCAWKFAAFKRYEAEHGRRYEGDAARGPTLLGTAIHAVVARVLRAASHKVVLGWLPEDRALGRALDEEMETAAGGRPIRWPDGKRVLDELRRGVAMVLGALRLIATRCDGVGLVEAPFRVYVGDIVVEGTHDFVGTRRPEYGGGFLLWDWKSGVQRPRPATLHRGHQLALYSFALAEGVAYPDTAPTPQEMPAHFEPLPVYFWPAEIGIVHLRDFTPYEKSPRAKKVKSRDEAAFYGVEVGERVRPKVGDPRGPGLYLSQRRPEDVADMKASLAGAVAMVRSGLVPKSIGDACSTCPFEMECSSEGHGPTDAERVHLEAVLDALPDDLNDAAPAA
ncbi:MAG: PD-(D/E)XK nuclease family protein [Myxococcota bacterium]